MKTRVTSLAVGLVMALIGLAGCQAPAWAPEMRSLDNIVNSATMEQFLLVRSAPAGTAYATFDWSTDGCSVVGSGPYNFSKACWRHDFAYRNLKRIEAATGGDMWNERNKYVADKRFQYDLKDRCSEYSSWIRPTCNVAAETYYLAVRAAPPSYSSQTLDEDPRTFRW